MNNNNKIKITMIITIMMIGLITNISHKALAISTIESDTDRYNDGYIAANNHMMSLNSLVKFIGTYDFQKHTPAYQNGYISWIDFEFNLKMPFFDYNTHKSVYIPAESKVIGN